MSWRVLSILGLVCGGEGAIALANGAHWPAFALAAFGSLFVAACAWLDERKAVPPGIAELEAIRGELEALKTKVSGLSLQNVYTKRAG